MKEKRIFSIVLVKSKGFVLLFLACVTACSGQIWQSRSVTEFDNIQIRYVDSAIDSNNNVHIFFEGTVRPLFEEAIYYLRVSPQGDILTDTIRIASSIQIPVSAVVLGGDRIWGLWSGWDGSSMAVEKHERDLNGNDQLTTALGNGSVEEAIYRASDQTVHWVVSGNSRYYRVTSEGDSIIWGLPIPETRTAVYAHIAISPSGTVWGAWRYSNGQPADILLARFGEDSTVMTYYPFGYMTGERWGIYDFNIDANNQFHFLVYHDTTQLSYCILDSTFELLEWHTLIQPQGGTWASLSLDEQGNSLVVWEYQSTLWGGTRTHQGIWEQLSILSETPQDVNEISIHSAQNGRWIFTCKMDTWDSVEADIYVFSYGFPPSSTNDQQFQPNDFLFSAFPNPFNSTTTFSFSVLHESDVRLMLFDVLGREAGVIYEGRVQAGEKSVGFEARDLATGIYFAKLVAGVETRVVKVVVIK